MARFLLAASPLDGHVMPLVRIGAHLCDRGHAVSMLTAPTYHRLARSHGMQPVELPLPAQPQRPTTARKAAVLPALVGRWRAGRADMRDVFIEPMAAQFGALQTALDATSFDAVLCDIGFTGALPLLLRTQRRPPVLVAGVGPLTLSSADTPPFGSGWQPRPGEDYAVMNRVVHRVFFGDIQARLDRELRRVGAPASPVFLTDWPRLTDRVLQLTVAEFEYPRRDLPPTVVFTGPVLPRVACGGRELPRRLTDVGTTVVHVTQGTWDNRDLTQLIQPTLDALAERDDLFIVATTGERGRTAPPGQDPRNAYVTDFVPYTQLLPHVDVMITNGGYGGVQHALAHGIPLIVAGGAADKPEIAARVAYAGAGIDLGTARLTRRALADALQQVLTDNGYRAAAQALGRQMRATRPLDTICDVLTTA